MPSGKLCIGAVFKISDEAAGHAKFHIIVAEKSGELATVYINTEARYKQLPETVQASQFPLYPQQCEFLKHESFADCGSIKEFNKSKINELIQKTPGYHCGQISQEIMTRIIDVLNRSKILERITKEKYSFRLK